MSKYAHPSIPFCPFKRGDAEYIGYKDVKHEWIPNQGTHSK